MAFVIPLPPQSGYKLSDYLFLTQRLLHDPGGNFYPPSDLTRYINLARQRVARDSGSVRYVQTGVTLQQGVDNYNIFTTLPYGPVTVDVLGISVYYGNLRIKLRYWPFTKLDETTRAFLSYQQVPAIFSRVGGGVIYVGPVPNQNYTSDWDTCCLTNDMQDDSSPEQLSAPFQEAVPFYAAYYAKQYEQSYGEADRFLQQYRMQLAAAMRAFQRRV